MTQNSNLRKLAQTLRGEKWIAALLYDGSAEIYLVGGCVRDAFLNKPIKDIDLVVDGLSMQEIKDILSDYGKVKIVGESFAVVKFKPYGHVGEDFDIAVPRMDKKVGSGHKGFQIITNGVDIIDDLKRRDFTINSIAVDVETGNILDPFNGINDISAKLLRATDSNAFIEDPLRMLRAIQFASRFRFNIEPNTLKLMKSNAHLIKQITGERILEEFNKIIEKKGSTEFALKLLYKTDLDLALFDNKFITSNFNGLDNLDMVSFYSILGNLGGTDSAQFYKNRLKGEYVITKALQTLDNTFDDFNTIKNERELKWKVFQMLKNSPILKDARLLHPKVVKIIDDMKSGKIPMKMGDIPVNGDEISSLLNVKNQELGNVISLMYQDALMNKFDWKNKEKTLKYLENI